MFGPLGTRLGWIEPLLWDPEERPAFVPAMNVWQDDKGLHVEAEVPGLQHKDLDVSVHEGTLVLKGEKKEAPAGPTQHRRERAFGGFTRTIEVPWEVESDKVEATLKDGVLHVFLPQTPAVQPKRIEIKADTK